MKQLFGRGCPAFYHSILLYCILSMAIVAKCILPEFAPIIPAFCSLLLPSYLSKNYASKIGASLVAIQKKSYIGTGLRPIMHMLIFYLLCYAAVLYNLPIVLKIILKTIIVPSLLYCHYSYTNLHN